MIDIEAMKARVRGERVFIPMDMVIDMERAIDFLVIWHPYPQEKPYCGDGRGEETYLVSTNADTVQVAYWEKFDGGFWYGTEGLKVIEWAELPKPYFRRK